MHDHHLSAAIGTGSTLIAFTVPDGWASFLGKFILAIVTSVIASTLSALIQRVLRSPK